MFLVILKSVIIIAVFFKKPCQVFLEKNVLNGYDILMINPICNVFDGGPNNHDNNDIDALLFFIEHRVIKIRDAINPDAGIILVNHMNEITREAAEDGLFITPRGANSQKHLYLLNNKLVDKL